MEAQESMIDQHQEPSEQNVEQVHENPESSSESSAQPVQETEQDRNWRRMRQRLEEKDEETRFLKAQMDRMNEQLQEIRQDRKQSTTKEEEVWLTETERKLAGEIKELKNYLTTQKAKEADYVMDRLKMRFPDFESVVNADNIGQLKRDNPTLAKAIASMQGDPYDQAVAAYEILKRSGYQQDGQTIMDKEKIEKNQKKPVSVQAVRKEGPLSEANRFALGLTPELRKELQREMNEASKRA